MEKNELFKKEEERLKEVISIIKKKIEHNQKAFDKQKNTIISIGEGMRGAHFTKEAMMSMYATELNRLRKVVKNPYFGSMNFKDNNSEKEIYIGKKIIIDDNNKILVYDWRTPIASMYYDYSIGPAKYEASGDIYNGEILSKKQIEIEDGNLISVEENDTLTDDKILLKYLKGNADYRLKSIVATIQSEQNKIIRNKNKMDIIIQGVAGSGKTTVALHRIAYLLYDDAKNINESNFLILGPNKYFLNYISDLLPDLDIDNVSQTTFEEIAKTNINTKYKLKSQNAMLDNILNNQCDENIIKYKSNIEFLKIIEKKVIEYIKENISEPITFEGLTLCNNNEIEQIFQTYSKNVCYGQKVNELKKRIIKRTKEDKSDLSSEIWGQYREEYLSLDKDSKRREEILNISNNANKLLESGCSKLINEYFKFMKINPVELYKKIISELTVEDINSNDINLENLKKYTLDNLKKKTIGSEDLAPLLFISQLMNTSSNNNGITRLFIDEGQDLSMAQYYILKRLYPNAKFEIFGDLNQSIYNYQGIHNWEDLAELLFEGKVQKLDLNKGYRTSRQICECANYVLDSMDNDIADNVARDGAEIRINELTDKTLNISLLQQLEELLNKKYKTIAIICKDDNEASKLQKDLDKLGLNINKISETDSTYNGGICIIPSYLSKGLEFDSVIIYNATNVKYDSNSEIDMKLLYVVTTRALHELHVNYTGELTKPFINYINKDEKNKVIKKSL